MKRNSSAAALPPPVPDWRTVSLTAASLLLSLGVAAALPAPARAAAAAVRVTAAGDDRDPLVDTIDKGKGRINYGAGVVKATGYGALPDSVSSAAQARLMALGAARADALRTLAMTVSAIQVTATTKVKNYQLESDVVETRLSALLQSPRVVSETVQPDGTAVVVVELPLYGANSVAAAVLPEVLPKANVAASGDTEAATGADSSAGGTAYSAPASATPDTWKGPAEPAVPVAAPRGAAAPVDLPGAVLPPDPTPLADNGPFTSLIVDCRGLNMEAIMSPKLVDTTGREVYGTVHVTPEYAIETGIVGYPRSMTEALRTARCGAHPLIVKALRPADIHRFNACIALEDGDRILAANNRDHFLEATRVIFLVDPLK